MTNSREKFEAWWKEKGQYTCPGGGTYEKAFCRATWIAGRESMREDAAHMAEKYFHSTTSKKIREIQP